jgi:hypothetical protein
MAWLVGVFGDDADPVGLAVNCGRAALVEFAVPDKLVAASLQFASFRVEHLAGCVRDGDRGGLRCVRRQLVAPVDRLARELRAGRIDLGGLAQIARQRCAPPELVALISVSSWLLTRICCSTPENCTSCSVNWFESIGSSGSWFWICAVRMVRKVSKLSDRLACGLCGACAGGGGRAGRRRSGQTSLSSFRRQGQGATTDAMA